MDFIERWLEYLRMAEMAALNCSTSLRCLCSALLLDTFISAFVGPIEGRAELCSAIRVEIYFELERIAAEPCHDRWGKPHRTVKLAAGAPTGFAPLRAP